MSDGSAHFPVYTFFFIRNSDFAIKKLLRLILPKKLRNSRIDLRNFAEISRVVKKTGQKMI